MESPPAAGWIQLLQTVRKLGDFVSTKGVAEARVNLREDLLDRVWIAGGFAYGSDFFRYQINFFSVHLDNRADSGFRTKLHIQLT